MILQDATALITGGSSGIGFAIARALTHAGSRVAITGRDATRLGAAARELGAVAVQADVGREHDVERTFREVLKAFGHLDVLVNNAGFGVNPSEVMTSFVAAAGGEQHENPSKLQADDIAHAVKAVLEMEDRGFTPELTVFATNPKD
ncbi:MAG: SDR family NAD(P)-dependent oxidoreductase [Acidobacteriota bacterium]